MGFGVWYLISGLDLWVVVVGDVVCLFFGTLSIVSAFFSFSFSLSLSFFSFFFLSTLKDDGTEMISHHLRPGLIYTLCVRGRPFVRCQYVIEASKPLSKASMTA